MRKRLVETLQDVIAAEQEAAELRRSYGVGAEAYCDSLMQAYAKNAPEREHLQDVRRALRWV